MLIFIKRNKDTDVKTEIKGIEDLRTELRDHGIRLGVQNLVDLIDKTKCLSFLSYNFFILQK